MSSKRDTSPLMTVRQLALRGGVSVHVVRSYLRRGILHAERRTDAGYQLFSNIEVQRLLFIRAAQQLGFTLTEIEEIVQHSRQRRSPCPLVRDIMRRRLRETSDQLGQLIALQARMATAANSWEALPDSIPTGNDVCGLIEAVANDHRIVPGPTRLPTLLRRSPTSDAKP